MLLAGVHHLSRGKAPSFLEATDDGRTEGSEREIALPVDLVVGFDSRVRSVERGVENEIGDCSTLPIVVVRMHLPKDRLAKGDELLWRIRIEEAEKREGGGQIVDNRTTAEQRRTLGGYGHASGSGVLVMHLAQMESIVEQLDEGVRITLVWALSTETGAARLWASEVTWAVGHPGITPARRRTVRSDFFRRIRRDIVRRSHARRLPCPE